MPNTSTDPKPTKYAYWVNLVSFLSSFKGVIKVDFPVELEADVKRLTYEITKGWTPSNFSGAQLIAWTPMPAENEYAPGAYSELVPDWPVCWL
jgi:hypothetical protein